MISSNFDANSSTSSPVPWWSVLLEGVALTALGILLFIRTDETVYTLVLFLGIWWLIGGMLALVSLFVDRTHWGWKLCSAILGILAGLFILAYPTYSAAFGLAAVTRVLGIAGVVIGIAAVVHALRGAGWGTGLLGGVGSILGLILLSIGTGVAIATAMLLGAIIATIGGISVTLYAVRLARSSSA